EAAIEGMLVRLEAELARLELESQAAPSAPVSAVARALAEQLSIATEVAELLVGGVLPALATPGEPLAADFELAVLRRSRTDTALRRNVHLSCLRAQKAALLVDALEITTAELAFVAAHRDQFEGWDFARLPFERETAADERLWKGWLQLASLAASRRLGRGAGSPLLAVFRLGGEAAELEPVLAQLAKATGWDQAALRTLAAKLELRAPDFRNAARLEGLARAVEIWRAAGVDVGELLRWAGQEPDDGVAAAIRNALKARYDERAWARVARAVSDPLRERARAALVDFTLQLEDLAAAGVRTADDLFEYFLIDVNMSPCMTTSRVRQAISSVQLFVQRCMLNLEPGVSPRAIEPLRWAWMKQYRLWEANRKVFLYPENWIEPELRDDKSQFFRELEADLVQTDVTPDTAEAAFRSYLYKLDEVSRLEICGICPDGIGGFNVFGRSYGQSKQHFFRQWDGTAWSGWERVPVDIQGDLPAPLLLPLVYNRRLYLFWPVIVEKSAGPDNAALGGAGGAEEKRPRRYLEAWLAYSEYRQGTWTPKRVSSGSILSYTSLDLLREPPPRERHSLRGEINTNTNELTVKLLVEMRFKYEDTVYEPKPTPSTDNCVELGSWGLAGCSGDLVVDSQLTLANPESPQYKSLLAKDSPVPTLTNLHGVGYRSGAQPNAPFSLKKDDLPGEGTDALTVIFDATPSVFQVLPAQNAGGAKTFPRYMVADAFDSKRPFVFQDARRAYWTRPVAIAPAPADASLPGAELLAEPTTEGARRAVAAVLERANAAPAVFDAQNSRLRFETFWHPHVCAFVKSLNEAGVAGLLTVANQQLVNVRASGRFENVYKPRAIVDPRFPQEDVQFDLQTAYGIYNLELFLHAPMLIAARLSREHRFADAQRWYHFLFDPTSDTGEPTPERFWRALPLRHDPAAGRLEALLRALADPDADPHLRASAEAQLESWRRNPFQPHRIARLRPAAYATAVFMRYLDNLIAWADHLFAQDTLEALNEATQLYVLAADLLGPRPRQVPGDDRQTAPSFASLRAAPPGGDLLPRLEDALVRAGVAAGSAASDGTLAAPMVGLSWSPAFCIPPNDRLLAYWDTVADRLFKLRHCQNLAGVSRSLPLFEPPIDPALLVRATALGIDLDAVVSERDAAVGHYRFRVQLAKAVELCGELRSFGGALLAALEKKDVEAISLLRATQETSILRLTRGVLEQHVVEAGEALEGLRATRELAELRFRFYDQIAPVSAREGQHLRLLDAAQAFQLVSQVTEIAAGAAALVPTITVGSAGSMGSPVVTQSTGGGGISASLNSASRALLVLSSLATYQANRTATLAAWDRRAADWRLQADVAAGELRQVDHQIAAAEVRHAIAQRELANHETRVAQAEGYEAAVRDKFTAGELYSWMASELSGLYFQLYSVAYGAAKRAERCFQLERDLAGPAFVRFGAWDSRRKGLLAGERLALDLRRMEMAYLDGNAREHELTR
ncbi:MAG TPA: neuraminidase-like domain-containing protein, partial [Thermoanaerobaculia bacterium]|nr:neuraminidase-like domain-containing protein [Thermoanaerobaculia bacterium]